MHPRGLRRAAWLLMAVACSAAGGSTACGSAAGETPPITPTSPVVAQAPPGEAVLPPVWGLVLPGAEDPAPRDLPMTELTGRLEAVSLPSGTQAIVHVTGRGSDDVWMVTRDGLVLHYDGRGVVSRGAPRCFTDQCCGTLIDCNRQPGLCIDREEPCHFFDAKCALRVAFDSLTFDGSDVVVRAVVDTNGLRGSLVTARLGPRGWSCEQGKGDLVYPGSAGRGDGAHADEWSLGASKVRFEGPAWLVNPLGGHSLIIDGRRVDLPDHAYHHALGLAVAAPDDLWLWSPESVWRGNGIGWTRITTGLSSIESLWFAGDGDDRAVWILGEEQLLARPLAREGWQRVAISGVTQAIPFGAEGFWLVGSDRIVLWDGSLRRATVPFGVERAWRGPRGELWLVGQTSDAGVASIFHATPGGP